MAFSFGFYDSVNGDRRYDALEMSSIFDGIITDGVLPNYGEQFKIEPAKGMGIVVKSGRAWFNHTWNVNSANLLLYLNEADRVLVRYDAVVLEVNRSRDVRANTIKLITGQASTSPMKPALINGDDVKQYPLAYIRIDPKMESVLSGNIEQMVGTSVTPLATGKLQTTDISQVFTQWDGEFEEWYNSIKDIVSDANLAALKTQIELKLDRSEKAKVDTPDTDDTKYLTPAVAKAIITNTVTPIGSIQISAKTPTQFAGTWLPCDKSTYAVTKYQRLFDIMGHMFGTVDKRNNGADLYSGVGHTYYGYSVANQMRGSNPNLYLVAVTRMRLHGSSLHSTQSGDIAVAQYNANNNSVVNMYYQENVPTVYGSGALFDTTNPIFFIGDTCFYVFGKNIYSLDGRGYLTAEFPGSNEIGGTSKSCLLAIIDDENDHYAIFTTLNGAIAVVSFRKIGTTNNYEANTSSSYFISGITDPLKVWVFNKQIYFYNANQLMQTTIGSGLSTAFTGSSTTKQVIDKFMLFRSRKSSQYDTLPRENESMGYSANNKICIMIYDSDPEYTTNGRINTKPTRFVVAEVADEYTGELRMTDKTIDYNGFLYSNYTISNSQFNIEATVPFIKTNSNGSKTVGLFASLYYYNPAVSYNRIYNYLIGACSGSDIRDANKQIRCYKQFDSRVGDNDPSVDTNSIKGQICESAGNGVIIPYKWERKNSSESFPYAVGGDYIDLTQFSLPWLNRTAGANVFYIRVQ